MGNNIRKEVQLLLPISVLIVLISTMMTIATISDQKVSAAKLGVFSPTGYCARAITTTCIPCDPGLPGGRDTCIASSEWPPQLAGSGLATATPVGNNTGTPSPPPHTTELAKQPSGHHHHKGGQTTASSSNYNSTGH